MKTFVASLIALVCAVQTAFAQSGGKKPTDWQTVAKKHGLSAAEIDLLRKNKFVIGAQSFKQVFTPYIYKIAPAFITSDSLLNAFHVLFEESIYSMETVQARKLPATLAVIWKRLDEEVKKARGDAKLIKAAAKRARIFLATARLLLDDKAVIEPNDIHEIAAKEAGRVTKGKGTAKPAWLGPPDPGFLGLDYSRFAPRGFYTRSTLSKRYFRAVRWLQSIPFRLDKDVELTTFLLLGRAWRKADGKTPSYASYWSAYRRFVGASDDADVSSVQRHSEAFSPGAYKQIRKDFHGVLQAGGGPQINDQMRVLVTGPNGKPEFAFRVLSAYRLPDGVLFHRTMKETKRLLPTGLEVAAVLGSPFAKERLAKQYPGLLATIKKYGVLFGELRQHGHYIDSSLYGEYLSCLRILLKRVEPDAPAFFRTTAWQAKTCQTALAGWSQLRHTWALQAKQAVKYMSRSRRPTGIVEPVPAFYGRFAAFLKRTRDELRNVGGLVGRDDVEEFREVVRIYRKVQTSKKGPLALLPEEIEKLASFDPQYNNANQLPRMKKAEAIQALLKGVGFLVNLYGKQVDFEKMSREDIEGLLEIYGYEQDLKSAWTNLINLCRRLEILAHKQLRNVTLTQEESEFIFEYGKALAAAMLYGGNSYGHPRDDAPRIVDVYSNPAKGKNLLVGIGRPRALWVLYPIKGREVLCLGAVLPYYEFAHSTPLTDRNWRTLLKSKNAPQQPRWVRGISVDAKPAK